MKSMSSSHVSLPPDFRHELPPLHALEIFATASRLGTFSRAARAFGVTQGAISRQIQQLEQHLGVTLFVRHKLGLSLTPEGEALLPVVEDAFNRVIRICETLRSAGQVLTLRMPPTIAGRWFLPLLPALQAVMPDMDVRVTTYDAWMPRFEDGDVDAAIIYGRGDWPGVEAVPLMPELLTPVCSPALAPILATPADLAKLPLLHNETPANGWASWLELAGQRNVDIRRGQSFDTSELVLSAATRGQGVALGDLNLIWESFADGILVAPFRDTVLNLGISYYLVYPPQRGQLPKIRALRDWLVEAAARHTGASGG